MNNEENNPLPEEGGQTQQSQQAEQTQPTGKVLLDDLTTNKQKKTRTALQWLTITVCAIMMACSVSFFQTPYGITLGGIAGVAYLLDKVALTQGIWMLIINGSLIVLGLIILGKQCTIKTIYTSALYTGTIYLLELIHDPTAQITDDPFLALFYAILLYGVGGALVFNCGASSGGTDIIALIFKKLTHLNVGVALLLVDFVIICATIITVEKEVLLYSFMGLIIKNFLLDSVIEGLGRTKYITVITTMPDEIGKYILQHHSYTIYDARGGYTGDEKKVILTICKRSEAWRLKSKIKQIDPSSFVIISNANEIVGKGFGGTVL